MWISSFVAFVECSGSEQAEGDFCHCLDGVGAYFCFLVSYFVCSLDNIPGETACIKWNSSFNNKELQLSIKRRNRH